MTSRGLSKLSEEIRGLLAKIPSTAASLPARRSKELREQLEAVATEFRETLAGLDPTKQPTSYFDPADPRLFGTFAAVALMGQDRMPLDAMETAKFYGAGIYAIYYQGAFPLYAPISNTEHPIYVGKADPAEPYARTPQKQGARLCGRLRDHRKNVAAVGSSIELSDFECRYLVVASGWQVAAEAALIALFHPLWNKETGIIYGFGKHGDDDSTRRNLRSPWDVLHPGRRWAKGGAGDAKTRAQIKAEVTEHFVKHPPVRDLEHVLHALLRHIKTR